MPNIGRGIFSKHGHRFLKCNNKRINQETNANEKCSFEPLKIETKITGKKMDVLKKVAFIQITEK